MGLQVTLNRKLLHKKQLTAAEFGSTIKGLISGLMAAGTKVK